MPTSDLYPLRFEPIFKSMLWGGRRLPSFLNRSHPTDDPVGDGHRPAAVVEGGDGAEGGAEVDADQRHGWKRERGMGAVSTL